METLRFLMATSFYPPYHLGGDAVHVQYLAEALAARGHEVHVEFSPAAYKLKRRRSPGGVGDARGVHLHPIPSPFGTAQPAAAYMTGQSRGVARFHASLTREVRPDVVHLHNISLLGRGILPRQHRGPMVYTAHDYWIRCPRNDLLKYGRQPCEAPSCVSCCLASRKPPQLWRYTGGWQGLEGLDFAIAPSRFMAQAIRSHLSCPVLHIPNFAPDPAPAGAIAEPADYYLFVGALEPHKGVLPLAEAAARLHGHRILFVGRGSLAAHLRNWRDGGVPNIELPGWLSHPQLEPLYERARALIIPSTCLENAPLAAVEALAWGAPLLASRRGGLEELLQGGAGRSFEPTSDGIVDAITQFEAGDLARRLRPAARSAYEENHRPESYLARYLDAVRDPPGLAGDSLDERPVPEGLSAPGPGAATGAGLP